MLSLCLFQSSTLVLLLHNRCRSKLLFWFIVSTIPKPISFYICPPIWLCRWLSLNVLSKPYSLLYFVVQWKHGLVSVHLRVCLCLCHYFYKRTQVLPVRNDTALSLPHFPDYKYKGQTVMARQQIQSLRCYWNNAQCWAFTPTLGASLTKKCSCKIHLYAFSSFQPNNQCHHSWENSIYQRRS